MNWLSERRHTILCVLLALSSTPFVGCARGARVPVSGAPAPAPPNAASTIDPSVVSAQLATLSETIPKDPAVRVELALVKLRMGDIEGAERDLDSCRKDFPNHPRAAYQLGMLYLERGRELDSVAPLLSAAALSPTDAAVSQYAALACFRAGRVAEAKRYARDALRIDGRFADPYLLLARVYDAHGTAEVALQNVDSYLERSAKPAPGYYLKGRIYARQASRDKGEYWLRKAVEAEPTNAEFWVSLGRVCYELFNATKSQEGLDCYKKALEADPNNPTAHRYLGHALLERRQFADSIAHLKVALERAEDPGPILYDLSQAFAKSGRSDEADRVLSLYRRHQDYIRGAKKRLNAISAAKHDRRNHVALITFCLDNGRYGAALAAAEAYRAQFGDDETVRPLEERAEIGVRAQQASADGMGLDGR